MPEFELEPLVHAYWQEYARRDEREGRVEAENRIDWPIWFRVDRMLRDGVVRELLGVGDVDLLLALAEAAPDDKARAYLGAGAIEDYLRHCKPDVDSVDQAARRSASFRYALTCAWFDRDLSPADAERLRRFGPSP